MEYLSFKEAKVGVRFNVTLATPHSLFAKRRSASKVKRNLLACQRENFILTAAHLSSTPSSPTSPLHPEC